MARSARLALCAVLATLATTQMLPSEEFDARQARGVISIEYCMS